MRTLSESDINVHRLLRFNLDGTKVGSTDNTVYKDNGATEE